MTRPPAEVVAAYPGLAAIDARPGTRLAEPAALLDELRRRCRPLQRDLLLFDPLECMAEQWGARLAQGFFTRCCPMLLDLGAVAYWSLATGRSAAALRRSVEEVTQCVLAVNAGRLRIAKAEGRAAGVQGAVFRYDVKDGKPSLRAAPAAARLGAALGAVRRERGLSQSELARLAGVSPSAISQAERGQRGLSLATLLQLTSELGITLDSLLRGEAAPGYRLARRPPAPAGADGRAQPLLDDPQAGLRAYVVRLPPRASASAAAAHKGVELVAVASGLVQVVLATGRPVLRSGEALLAERSAITGWRNLGDAEALFFLVVRD